MDDHIKFLIDTYGKNDQRTEAWHTKRGEMLTASEIWKTTKEATPAQTHELIMSKLTPREPGAQTTARALLWGTQFEPIAKSIFEKMNDVKVVDTTCIPHSTHTFLGASPDGILISNNEKNGRLVEFKCPISRDFDEGSSVPSSYIHQMQLQMECTGLNACEYAEFKFKVVPYSEWADTDVKYKSAILVFDDGRIVYKDVDDTRSIGDWKQSLVTDDDYYQVAYWVLTKSRFHIVYKDPAWLETHLPYFEKTWSEIVQHRAAGTFPERPKDKSVMLL